MTSSKYRFYILLPTHVYIYISIISRYTLDLTFYMSMSAFSFLSVALLLLFLINVSCSLIYEPIDTSSYEANNPDLNALRWMIHPKAATSYRLQRSRFDHPRFNRNAWFRVSTYQHKKPSGASEEKTSGDNLMRWG